MLRIVSSQNSPSAALAAALAARGDLPRMRKALAALSDADLESAAMRCLCYVAAGVKRENAFRLDDEALRVERLRRAGAPARPAASRSRFLAAASAACAGGAA